MIYALLAITALVFFFMGFMTAHIKLQKEIKGLQLLLKADKQAKILTKKEAQDTTEPVVKLDFASLIESMEQKYTMWTGHKHQKYVGQWINWIRCILDKDQNTRR